MSKSWLISLLLQRDHWCISSHLDSVQCIWFVIFGFPLVLLASWVSRTLTLMSSVLKNDDIQMLITFPFCVQFGCCKAQICWLDRRRYNGNVSWRVQRFASLILVRRIAHSVLLLFRLACHHPNAHNFSNVCPIWTLQSEDLLSFPSSTQRNHFLKRSMIRFTYFLKT